MTGNLPGEKVVVELPWELLILLKIRQERAARMVGGDISIGSMVKQVLEEHLLTCSRRD